MGTLMTAFGFDRLRSGSASPTKAPSVAAAEGAKETTPAIARARR